MLRGSHDGFVEAVVPNMALLRRRIRDPHLTMEGHKVGSRTHNDAVLCYLDDKVDQDLLRKLRGKLLGLDVRSLSMAQESLAEAIRPKQWYNPFPKVRYTERPDAGGGQHHGGEYRPDGGQFPLCDDFAHRFFRFHTGIQ